MQDRRATTVPAEPGAQADQVPEELQEAAVQPSRTFATLHPLTLSVVTGSLGMANLDAVIPAGCSGALSRADLCVTTVPTPLCPGPRPDLLFSQHHLALPYFYVRAHIKPTEGPKNPKNRPQQLILAI